MAGNKSVEAERIRLIMYDRESHLLVRGPIVVGDSFPVFRGNGPREGDRIGTANVTAIEDGNPILDIHLFG